MWSAVKYTIYSKSHAVKGLHCWYSFSLVCNVYSPLVDDAGGSELDVGQHIDIQAWNMFLLPSHLSARTPANFCSLITEPNQRKTK